MMIQVNYKRTGHLVKIRNRFAHKNYKYDRQNYSIKVIYLTLKMFALLHSIVEFFSYNVKP